MSNSISASLLAAAESPLQPTPVRPGFYTERYEEAAVTISGAGADGREQMFIRQTLAITDPDGRATTITLGLEPDDTAVMTGLEAAPPDAGEDFITLGEYGAMTGSMRALVAAVQRLAEENAALAAQVKTLRRVAGLGGINPLEAVPSQLEEWSGELTGDGTGAALPPIGESGTAAAGWIRITPVAGTTAADAIRIMPADAPEPSAVGSKADEWSAELKSDVIRVVAWVKAFAKYRAEAEAIIAIAEKHRAESRANHCRCAECVRAEAAESTGEMSRRTHWLDGPTAADYHPTGEAE